MNRKTAHFQKSEPLAENILRRIRFITVNKYIPKDSTVADLGCGFRGTFLHNIADKIKHGKGFDIVVSKNTTKGNIKLLKSDLNKDIKNRGTLFTVVTAMAVLEHVENPNLFIQKARKLLKAGGLLIITTPHSKGRRLLEFLSFKLRIVSSDEIHDHKNYFNEISIKKLLLQNKFKIKVLKTFEFGYNLLCVAQK